MKAAGWRPPVRLYLDDGEPIELLRLCVGRCHTTAARYKSSRAELIMGTARFIAPRTVEVALNDGGTRSIAGERVFLNLGTRAAMPDVPGLAASQPLTHAEALDLDRLPDHLIVLGAGYVGVELAQAMRHFGARVTLIEKEAQLVSREDPDVGGELLELFQKEGIDVLLRTRLHSVQGRSRQHIKVRVEDENGVRTLEGSDLLVAVGRAPNTHGIGLELAGIKLSAQGFVEVNERLEGCHLHTSNRGGRTDSAVGERARQARKKGSLSNCSEVGLCDFHTKSESESL